ncbi:dipeptidase [Bryobacter aggregatus]|uniref:dipeptidase n=1 Tax=Bryobacter aggregatus TaxID=360054 RepID=UPI000560ECD8|nr:dipeptidase [Bryobacter aggregatus]
MEDFLDDLIAWLRIPSISALPEHANDVHAAAVFTAGLFRKAGLENVGLIEGEGHPLVVGDWLHAPGKPTILCYGHYDVQPAEPLHLWNTPPFEPTVLGDNLYARGAADDKGLAIILIKAVERLRQQGPLPVNLRFLFEGEEESGGDHVSNYLRTHPEALACDAALICDTEMFAPELPTLCVGLRGILYAELEVQTGETDLHSGVYGGAVPNAIEAAARIVSSLKDLHGRILIPGFYDDVAAPTAEELASWARLPFDAGAFQREEARVHALTGEPGFGVLERSWARPTFEIHGIRGGFTGPGAKTVIPCEATVKFSCRLAPGQDPVRVGELLNAAIEAAALPGVRTQLKILHSAKASVVDPANPYVRKAALAMTEVFGRETVLTRSGGSIPIVGLFAETLGVPSVLTGFGLPDDNLHAPNEKVYLPNIERGIEAIVRYWQSLGEAL